jgi:hypothetical protein
LKEPVTGPEAGVDVLDGKFIDGDVIQADVDHGNIVFRK